MKADLFTLDSGSRIVITVERATSSYGVPVLLLEDAADGPPALGPHDELEPGLPAHLLVSAFLERRLPRGTALRRGRKTRSAVTACERFLEAALPLVRQTPAPGYVAVPFAGVIGGGAKM